ncbi:hypothetical protein MCHI_000304 [Candidatus Magnetoovum chiemensis]|nr:hypothetical protein MCHI_000304 [Candidatus Magnetoovum chiemensis]
MESSLGDYSITFARSASKELEAFDEALTSRILHKIVGITAIKRLSSVIAIGSWARGISSLIGDNAHVI